MHRFMVVAAVAMAALLTAPAVGHGADGTEIAAFADRVASAWAPHQDARGAFIDPILGRRGGYGTPMLGYGLLRAGVRRGDPQLIRAGIRAFNSRLKKSPKVLSYFALLPFAKAYVFAKRELGDNPLWRRSRAGWERYLRRFERGPQGGGPTPGCIARPACFHNHEVVGTAAEIALLQTGLRSRHRRSPLRNRRSLQRRIMREVNVVLPSFVGRSGRLTGPFSRHGIGLLSDSGSWSLSYHGLSTAMYALSLGALPSRATRRGRLALRRATGASLGLMAPDGDVTWLGSRQQEAWALASETAVGMIAPRVAPIAPLQRDALRTMARTGFYRLAIGHPIGSAGLANTPRSFTNPARDFARGILSDPINYNGLTVLLLNLAADRAGTYDTTSIPMDHDGHMIVPAQSGFAAVRHGSVWYALSRRERPDPRYAFGLLALKVRDRCGWRDLVKPRPVPDHGTLAGRSSVGPVIVRGGRRYRPVGRRFRPGSGGAMTVVTSFRAGSRRFTAPVSYTPTSDGIVISLTTRASDIVEFTSFHPTPELKLFPDGIGDDEARISVPRLAGITRREGFVSCCVRRLTAATLRVLPDASGWVSYRVSPAANPVAAIDAAAMGSPVAALERAATVQAG